MHAAQVYSRDAQQRALDGLQFQRSARLDAVRGLAVLLKTYDCRVLLEAAVVQRRSTAQWRRSRIRVGGVLQQSVQSGSRERGSEPGIRKQTSIGVQSIFKGTACELSQHAAAGGRLAHQERRR